MGYDVFKFGALYLDDKIQFIPQQTTWQGNTPRYDGYAVISIRPTEEEECITWIKPYGFNLLVADRVLLNSVSWRDLNESGFIAGKTVLFDGQRFHCRLLQVGKTLGAPNEWDKILNETSEDDTLWHWNKIRFWGTDVSDWMEPNNVPYNVSRGYFSARGFELGGTNTRLASYGFRPVLEPLGPDKPKSNCMLDGIDFCLSSIPGGENFCPILQPVKKDVFVDIPIGKKVRMYTLMENGRPVHMDEQIKDLAQVTLTDRYFGDEYLISWIISNGVAVTSQSVKKQV